MPVLVDDGEHFVPHHEATVGGDPEQPFRDLAVGAAHADLEHADAHAFTRRLGNVLDVRRVRDTRLDRQREHQAAVRPPSMTSTLPVTNSAVAR